MSTNRIGAFSDGVFAIAITVLVLHLKVPAPGGGRLGDDLAEQWPSYPAYVVSFLVIGDHLDQPPRGDRPLASDRPAADGAQPLPAVLDSPHPMAHAPRRGVHAPGRRSRTCGRARLCRNDDDNGGRIRHAPALR